MIKAIDLKSSNILWSINLSKNNHLFSFQKNIFFSSGLAIKDNKIYVGNEKGEIFCINKFNGNIIWKTDIQEEIISLPVVSQGLVLIHTSNEILFALNDITGLVKWNVNFKKTRLSIRGRSTPIVIYKNIVIVGSDYGYVSAFFLSNGELIWENQISDITGDNDIDQLHSIRSQPIIDEDLGILFVIAYNGNLAAIDIYSNKIIWKKKIGSVNNMVLINHIIYLVDQDDRIFALSKYNGTIVWKQNHLLNHQLTSPLIYKNYLILGDKNGLIYWINIYNGNIMKKKKISNSSFQNSMILAEEYFLALSKNGILFLLKN
ncbi:MAG: PQQ-binding-like beta-propeller repeat protein [Arsenophonus sp.]|nr:MAG: PQQ-binding-like beta-propeller repeat protein [Arsenophonus sp.]